MKILHIESDPFLAMGVREALHKATVERADTGEYGIDLATLYAYDAIICGHSPDKPSIEIIKHLRAATGSDQVMTVWGRGYVLGDTPMARAAESAALSQAMA